MRRRVERLLVILLAVILFAFHADLKRAADPRAVQELAAETHASEGWRGKMAPDFTLDLRDGTKFHLADHVGKEVIVLNFFATWCAPCRAEAPELNRFALAWKGKPVTVIGIDADEKPPVVYRYVQAFHVPYAVGIDGGGISEAYAATSLPTTIIISGTGHVLLYENGAIMNTDVAFRDIIPKAVADMRAGHGITRDQYLAAARGEAYWDVREPRSKSSDEPKLTGHAAELAAQIDCLCGCGDKLTKCNCSRAGAMKKKLAAMKFDGHQTNADIIRALDAEFCIRDGKKEDM